jgi:hypothetical protein
MNHVKEYTVERMCRVMKVSRSSYYNWLKNPVCKRKIENEMFSNLIYDIYHQSKRTYGSPRIHKELKERGFNISQRRIAKIMRALGIRRNSKSPQILITNIL